MRPLESFTPNLRLAIDSARSPNCSTTASPALTITSGSTDAIPSTYPTATGPMPVKHGRRPLEARTNWDPWLPATEAYPEVGGKLQTLALFVLAVAVALLLVTALAGVAMW